MRIEWTPTAVASARRSMHDQDGMRAIGASIATLASTEVVPVKPVPVIVTVLPPLVVPKLGESPLIVGTA